MLYGFYWIWQSITMENIFHLWTLQKDRRFPQKYLESIVSVLSKNKFVTALRGKGGGYRLARDPGQYTIGSILRLTEGSTPAPVACLEDEPNLCERAASCMTPKMWKGCYKVINEYFDGITLQDLLEQDSNVGDYVV